MVPFPLRRRSVLCHDQDWHGSALGPLLERSCLPVSSDEHLTGTLEQNRNGLVLRTDGGGTWELESTLAARELIGSRVENGLVCDQIWPAGQPRPQAVKLRLEFLLTAALVAYGLYATIGAAISTLR
jgi:Protein of unknown function (DUF5818)